MSEHELTLEEILHTFDDVTALVPVLVHRCRVLEQRLAAVGEANEQLVEIMYWTQAAVTALAVGDICSGSPLHHKLRDMMIAYRAANGGLDE
jgi:hypothetical protein